LINNTLFAIQLPKGDEADGKKRAKNQIQVQNRSLRESQMLLVWVICLDFDLTGLADRPDIDSIRPLHEVLKSEYGPDNEHGALCTLSISNHHSLDSILTKHL
jgi:hypothetical protein